MNPGIYEFSRRRLLQNEPHSCALSFLLHDADSIRAGHFRELLAQQLSAAAEPRHNRSDRDTEYSGRFFIRELFDINQQDHRPEILLDAVERREHVLIGNLFRDRRLKRRALLEKFLALLDNPDI